MRAFLARALNRRSIGANNSASVTLSAVRHPELDAP
jgi:hypothetical protein